MVLDRMILTTGSLTIQNVVLVNFSHIDDLVLLVFKDTFISISVISWQSVLLVEETRSTRKKPPTCSQVTDKLYDMKLIFFSSITGSYWTKLGCDTPWMVLFQNQVVSGHLVLQMVVMALDWLKTGNLWKSASSEPLDGMKSNLVQLLLGWSPSKIVLLTINNTR